MQLIQSTFLNFLKIFGQYATSNDLSWKYYVNFCSTHLTKLDKAYETDL